MNQAGGCGRHGLLGFHRRRISGLRNHLNLVRAGGCPLAALYGLRRDVGRQAEPFRSTHFHGDSLVRRMD